MKKPNNRPTEVGQRVKLRGRSSTGEVVAWWPTWDIELVKRVYTIPTPACTVAWDWECYVRDPPDKGIAWGYCSPDELELIDEINTNTNS